MPPNEFHTFSPVELTGSSCCSCSIIGERRGPQSQRGSDESSRKRVGDAPVDKHHVARDKGALVAGEKDRGFGNVGNFAKPAERRSGTAALPRSFADDAPGAFGRDRSRRYGV